VAQRRGAVVVDLEPVDVLTDRRGTATGSTQRRRPPAGHCAVPSSWTSATSICSEQPAGGAACRRVPVEPPGRLAETWPGSVSTWRPGRGASGARRR
jgi:hypothetical protein